MGVQPGFPDLVLLVASQDCHALFIELKSATGRQEDSQKEYQALVEAQGYRYALVRSFDEFKKLIENYMTGNI